MPEQDTASASPSGGSRPRPRERARARTIADIVRLGREHLALHGAAALSLRAVARDLGVVSSAVYRYVENREELLTLLLIDAYNELGDEVDAAVAAVPEADLPAGSARWARAVRRWALREPARYGLLFGSPVPGYRAPAERTTGPGTRVIYALMALLDGAYRAGRLAAPGGAGRRRPPAGRGPGDASGPEMGLAVPDGLLARGALVWTSLFGAVSFEVFGQYGADTFTAPDELFAHHLAVLADLAGLARRPDPAGRPAPVAARMALDRLPLRPHGRAPVASRRCSIDCHCACLGAPRLPGRIRKPCPKTTSLIRKAAEAERRGRRGPVRRGGLRHGRHGRGESARGRRRRVPDRGLRRRPARPAPPPSALKRATTPRVTTAAAGARRAAGCRRRRASTPKATTEPPGAARANRPAAAARACRRGRRTRRQLGRARLRAAGASQAGLPARPRPRRFAGRNARECRGLIRGVVHAVARRNSKLSPFAQL